MTSIAEECSALRKDYDDCFNRWFADRFLKGHTDDSECAPVFLIYQQCVKTAMKKHNVDFRVKDSKLGPESNEDSG